MIKVGIVGGTGYTGVELLRLLLQHPQVEIATITSRKEAGKPVAELFANLRGHLDLCFEAPDQAPLAQCDLVFFATPNGTAMHHVPGLLARGVRVIDFAADFRLREAAEWERWYKVPHICPELLSDAVYGLPEVNRDAIRNARLVANPGCYATAVQLGLLPLVETAVIDLEHVIADCKSGVSGAGRGAEIPSLLCEASDNFKAYKVSGHRHHPEIRQGLRLATGCDIGLTFIPHLIPMIRGIFATLYGRLTDTTVDLQQLYEQRYANDPCVDVLPPGSEPETRSVRGTNLCRIAVQQSDDTAVILVVEDNLLKGAAGQAVQNMNLMFGCGETQGLDAVALLP